MVETTNDDTIGAMSNFLYKFISAVNFKRTSATLKGYILVRLFHFNYSKQNTKARTLIYL